MATADKTTENMNLASVALELFKGRSLHHGVTPRQLAIDCFRDAAEFLAAAEDALAGKIDWFADDTNPLDSAFAPNLKRTHPINLMSRAWGDLKKVQATLAELDANPAAESYDSYGWGKPEVNQARALFPAVVKRSKQFIEAK
jgi:hypothetical protein